MANQPDMKRYSAGLSLLWAPVKALIYRARTRHETQRANRIERNAFLEAFRLDDRMLDDIGVTREEVEWAASLPLHVDAAGALHAKVGRRPRCGAALE